MTTSLTYRFIASVLSLSILIGVSLPAGLHAMSEVFCDEDGNEMHQSMSAHGDDCPMDMDMDDAHQAPKHHQAHDLGFACACSVDEAPVKTEAQAQLKHKVPVAVIRILDEDHTDQTETNAFQNPVSDALSPPPIYLLNETFLN